MAGEAATKVVRLIVNGKFDSQLDRFQAAITRRKEALVQIKAASFEVDDRVIVNSRVKPKYLYGATGTITELDGNRIRVDLDSPRRRFWHNVGFFPASIDRLEG